MVFLKQKPEQQKNVLLLFYYLYKKDGNTVRYTLILLSIILCLTDGRERRRNIL